MLHASDGKWTRKPETSRESNSGPSSSNSYFYYWRESPAPLPRVGWAVICNGNLLFRTLESYTSKGTATYIITCIFTGIICKTERSK